jgi:hypothetical protein
LLASRDITLLAALKQGGQRLMGVTLDLRLIEHERIVVRGLEAVNEAIRHNDPDRLRDYLRGLPIEVDPAVVDDRESRLAKLRELNAPAIIIRNEEQFLRVANGEAYRPEEFKNSTLDELRQVLGTWCWVTHSYSLDKAWNELHWFLEPMAGAEDLPLYPLRPSVGDPSQSVFNKALQGEVHYSTDALGDPVIRTLGSHERDCSGYNPPETCEAIFAALQGVDPHGWEEHVPFRRELYRRAMPGMEDEEVAGFVEDELAMSREMFSILVSVYSKAVAKKYGVSCEYSL